VARADEEVGMVAVDDDEREVALELRECLAHGLDEVALVVPLDEVGDRLGIRLGAVRVAVLGEARPQLAVVLDDAVEHDRDALRFAARERMGVLLGDGTVRGPARVPETGRRRGAVGAGALLQVAERTDCSDVVEPVAFQERDARGVVAPVLETLEPLQEKPLALPRPDVPDDPAHAVASLGTRKSPAAPSVGLSRALFRRARRC
jgi:hypothetical protein